MKKILFTILTTLILSGVARSECNDDIDFKANEFSNISYNFEFLNKSNKEIIITEIRLLTKNDQIIKSTELYSSGTLKPFGRLVINMNIFDINKNMIAFTEYLCNYK